MTIVEFLLARIEEDGERERTELLADMAAQSPSGHLTPAMEKRVLGTTVAAGIDIRKGFRHLAVATAGTLRGINGGWLKRQAATYADHPEYQAAWRP